MCGYDPRSVFLTQATARARGSRFFASVFVRVSVGPILTLIANVQASLVGMRAPVASFANSRYLETATGRVSAILSAAKSG